jgi:hypothetical protein
MTFEEWVKLILQSNVVAAMIVGLFGILTLKLGLGKFRSEKWWERKSAAYVAAIEAMHAMYAQAKATVDAERSGSQLSPVFQDKLTADSLAGLMDIRKSASISPFLMSKAAASIVSNFVREIDNLDVDDDPPFELYQSEIKIASDAILRLTLEAKRDLQTP